VNPDKFPWKWSTMTDREIRMWLFAVTAGRDASREWITLASAEWTKDSFGNPDISRLPPRIDVETRHNGGAVWWDFDATVRSIRKHFPYAGKDESP